MRKYNLRSIMKKAWDIFRATGKKFAECLHLAWFSVKSVQEARESAGITEEAHTWFGWKRMGMEVIHESKALFKAIVFDHKTKSGTRMISYFGASQVHPA